MNHKLKRKWVAALRGGTWTECRGFFRLGCGRCVLGVLFEVIGCKLDEPISPDWLLKESEMTENQFHHVHYAYEFENKSFSEIADWIEENL